MKRNLYCVASIAAIIMLLASSSGPQGRGGKVVRKDGPFKVVLSKPLEPQGWKVGSIYSEQENLTELFNQLAIEGLSPLFTDVLTERLQGRTPQDRLLVVCRRP